MLFCYYNASYYLTILSDWIFIWNSSLSLELYLKMLKNEYLNNKLLIQVNCWYTIWVMHCEIVSKTGLSNLPLNLPENDWNAQLTTNYLITKGQNINDHWSLDHTDFTNHNDNMPAELQTCCRSANIIIIFCRKLTYYPGMLTFQLTYQTPKLTNTPHAFNLQMTMTKMYRSYNSVFFKLPLF